MTGIPMATYRRVERGQITSPPIGYLFNWAHIHWVEWHPMKDGPNPPSDPAQ